MALLAGLSTAPAADARMHYPARGHRIMPGTSSPLDGFTAPAGGYSFRLLRSAYLGTGAAVRLRRASDNAESDIGFSGSRDFDTATATAFCSATTCFIRTIYDQSGNARDLTQTTAASQPALVFGCKGGLPCLRTVASELIVGSSFTPTTGITSYSVVADRTAGAGFCVWMRVNATNRLGTGAANVWSLFSTGSITAAANDNIWHAGTGVIANGAASVLNIDGVETTGSITGTVTAGLPGIVGAGAGTTCQAAEGVFWDNYQLTAGERATLQANQKSYWGTP